MAVMYVFSVNDPQNAGAFPATVMASDWYAAFMNYAAFNSLGGNSSYVWSFVFDNSKDLDTWLTTYAITDSQLLADLYAWCVDHGVEYSHKCYELPTKTLRGMF
jgi:hypothetical protein